VNDVLVLHGQAREMEELKRKLHNNSIPMKVEIMAVIIRKLSSQSTCGLIVKTWLTLDQVHEMIL